MHHRKFKLYVCFYVLFNNIVVKRVIILYTYDNNCVYYLYAIDSELFPNPEMFCDNYNDYLESNFRIYNYVEAGGNYIIFV